MCKKNEELLLKEEKIRIFDNISQLIGTVSVIVLLICFIKSHIFNNTQYEILENFGIVLSIIGMLISLIMDMYTIKFVLSIKQERERLQDLKSNPERKVRYISDSKNSLELDLIDFLLTSEQYNINSDF